VTPLLSAIDYPAFLLLFLAALLILGPLGLHLPMVPRGCQFVHMSQQLLAFLAGGLSADDRQHG
jgi:hypothetical protein